MGLRRTAAALADPPLALGAVQVLFFVPFRHREKSNRVRAVRVSVPVCDWCLCENTTWTLHETKREREGVLEGKLKGKPAAFQTSTYINLTLWLSTVFLHILGTDFTQDLESDWAFLTKLSSLSIFTSKTLHVYPALLKTRSVCSLGGKDLTSYLCSYDFAFLFMWVTSTLY